MKLLLTCPRSHTQEIEVDAKTVDAEELAQLMNESKTKCMRAQFWPDASASSDRVEICGKPFKARVAR